MADVALNKLPTSKTVVFGDPGALSAEQRLNSQWHIKFIAWTIGFPSAVALAYAAIMNASMAAGLATTIPWKVGIGLLAAVLTMALGALPVAAGMLWKDEETRPAAYAATALLLLVCLPISLFAAGGHAYYAMHSKYPAPATPDDKPLVDFDPFHGKRFRFSNESNGRWYEFTIPALLERTNACRNLSYDPFEYSFQKELCRDWRQAERMERKRRAGLGSGWDDASEMEAMFSPETIADGRWFLAIWGPFAALLFGLLGFVVAGRAIAKMILISGPPPAEPAATGPKPASDPLSNGVLRWGTECLEGPVSGPPIEVEDAYSHYVAWCLRRGLPTFANSNAFSIEMQKPGGVLAEKKGAPHKAGKAYYLGVRINPGDELWNDIQKNKPGP